jgi:asparagine synthase (glutamine-hydrolysing)
VNRYTIIPIFADDLKRLNHNFLKYLTKLTGLNISMCGIAGYLHFNNDRTADESTLRRMTDTLFHRGPDSGGYYTNKNIALGHRRLSIIDLSVNANQPMYDRDTGTVIVFNGEIYNYIELRDELTAFGFRFLTSSDTEVILNAYKKWGFDCVTKFNGMWAFALWDDKKHSLWLSRDRLGKKPLYYSCFDSSIIFASEIKSIFSYGVPRHIRPELLELYLTFLCIPSPYSFFKNIFKLEPGHNLLITGDGRLEKNQYWDFPHIDEQSMIRDKKSVDTTFEELLRDAIKIRMRSDAPFGAFLSGGLDSSAIVGMMADHSRYPVNTFTIGFNDKKFDERDLAKLVAQKFNTQHHELIVEPFGIADSLNLVARHFDEPFGDASAMPTGYVACMASRHVKMVLTGDGGDEVLSGYPSYQSEYLASLYQKFPLHIQESIPAFIKSISMIFSGSFRLKCNWLYRLLNSSKMDFNSRFLIKAHFVEKEQIKRILHNIKQDILPEDYFSNLMAHCPFKDPFYKLMYVHFKHSLSEIFLPKVDRMCMAYSLETRSPFLDFRIVEYMARVHRSIKMENLKRKSILTRTIGKKLPKELLNRPKKGFSVPLHKWFIDDSSDNSSLQFSNLYAIGMNRKALDEIVHYNSLGKSDYGNFIWILSVLNKVCC